MPRIPFKMNLDYEAQLFEGKSSEKINHALEYLAFYLSGGPFATTANYSEVFLRSIEELTGHRPELIKTKDFRNMWGVGADLEKERELNSKLLSAALTQKIVPKENVLLAKSADDISGDFEFPLIVKRPQSMSGRGVKRLLNSIELEETPFPFVLEPLRNRIFDFSHFIYPSGEVIAYENRVDDNFQYCGSIFHRMNNPQVSSIPQFQNILSGEVHRYEKELQSYRQSYEELLEEIPKNFGYSIDSFVYEHEGVSRIRTCSEFNFRRTMGWLCFELGKKLTPGSSWIALRLFFMKKDGGDIRKYFHDLGVEKKHLILSPPESRIQVVLFSATSSEEGEKLLAYADRFDINKFADTKL